MEAYCVKCRKKIETGTNQIQIVRSKNGRDMAKSKCPHCGTKVTRFLKTKED